MPASRPANCRGTLLALKTLLVGLDRTPTLAFDEVDAGIGARVAAQVGERLAGLAGAHQVFAITHLAQIAARAGPPTWSVSNPNFATVSATGGGTV